MRLLIIILTLMAAAGCTSMLLGADVARDGAPSDGAFLAKPFERDDLIATVRDLVKLR